MSTPNPFVGTWRLRDAFALTDAGTRVPSPLGEKVLGQIMYDGAGNMSAQLMAEGRPRFSARAAEPKPTSVSATTRSRTTTSTGRSETIRTMKELPLDR